MTQTECRQGLVELMVDYTAFLEKMAADEKEKLSALLSNDIKRIEPLVSLQQANSMRIQNYERRRLQLQKDAGLEDLGIRDGAQQLDESGRAQMLDVAGRLEKALSDIRFYNQKSMQAADDNLRMVRGNQLESEQMEQSLFQAKF